MAQGADLRSRIVLEGADKAAADLKKVGDAGDKAFSQVSKGAGTTAVSLNELSGATNKAAGNLASLRTSLSGVNTGFNSLLNIGGSLKTAFAGFAAFEGARKAVDKVSDTLEHFREIRNTSLATAIPLDTVKALDLAMRQAGISGEKSAGALIQFAGAAGDASQKWKTANKELLDGRGHLEMIGGAANTAAQGMTTLRGGMGQAADSIIKVVRGAEKLDESRDVYAGIGIDISKFIDAAGRTNELKLFEAAIKRINQLMKAGDVRGARAGALLLGEDDVVKLSKAVQILAENWDVLIKQAGTLPPSKQDLANLDEYDKAVANLAVRWDTIWGGIAAGSLKFSQWNVVNLDEFIKGWEGAFGELKRGFIELGAAFSGAFDVAWGNIKTAGTDLFNWMLGWVKTIGSALSSAFAAIGSLPDSAALAGGASQFAAGGRVRGPGSGTSDSIMARLSNGEFVMRAAAVRHFGADFMAALNHMRNPFAGYSLGGLIDRRLPGFAEGGLVGTAGAAPGTPVTLVLDGQRFSMMSDNAVAESLLRVARKRNMLSAMRV
jgi:hypothetical protein